jgi:ubiquinone/menaquinone biosynthesis C-methylase UbiE
MRTNAATRRRLQRLIPRPLRQFFRDIYCHTHDALGVFVRGRDALIPPKRLLRLSTDPTADFRSTGRTFMQFLVASCGLRPEHRVLDIGCGVGRVAVALTDYLDSRGGYEGFDVVADEIAWCATHISPRFPNFQFRLADVRNKTYNPTGRLDAAAYRFPYDAGTFDVAIASSVFTHMLPRDMTRYVMEMSRVLNRTGRCFASFYLLNEAARANIAGGNSAFEFAHAAGGCCVEDPNRPEVAVAYEEAHIRDLFQRYGFSIEAVMPGAWSSAGTQMQDIVIASRTGNDSL